MVLSISHNRLTLCVRDACVHGKIECMYDLWITIMNKIYSMWIVNRIRLVCVRRRTFLWLLIFHASMAHECVCVCACHASRLKTIASFHSGDLRHFIVYTFCHHALGYCFALNASWFRPLFYHFKMALPRVKSHTCTFDCASRSGRIERYHNGIGYIENNLNMFLHRNDAVMLGKCATAKRNGQFS